jgi:hypothetical protein
MSYYKSDQGYLAIGVQADIDTPVIPDVFIPLLEEDISSDPNNERVDQIVSKNWKSNLILQGNRTNGGTIKINADPENLGHLLNMTIKKGTTTGDTNGYTHPFTVDEGDYYTVEILKGNYVHRLVGCRVKKLSLSFDNGKMQAEAELIAKSKFNYGTLKTALTGVGMTEVVFDEEFDPEPCKGLVAGDVIQVWSSGVATDVTVATVSADYKSITCASTTVTASAGALITLKEQTPVYSTLQRPFRFGQMLVGIGANEVAATAAAGSYATATPVDELTFEFDNATEEHHSSGDNDPLLLNGVPDANVKIKKLFETADDIQQWNDIAKKAITIIITGDEIGSGGTYASFTLKLYNVKPSKASNKISVGDYVYDETEFFVEYDDTAEKAVEATLVNAHDGSDY